MLQEKIYTVGFKPCHLDALVEETTSSLVLDLDKTYNVGQFEFLMKFGKLSYDQALLKVILKNIDKIKAVVVDEPKYLDSEHKQGFIGKVSDLDYEHNIILVYDDNNHYYNIRPSEVKLVHFKDEKKSEKIKQYIENNRKTCLNCYAVNSLKLGELSVCDGRIYQYVFCQECKEDWVSEYTLNSVHIND